MTDQRTVFDHFKDSVQVLDPQFRYVYMNHAVIKQSRATREALVGKTMMECYPGIEGTQLFQAIGECMQSR